MFKVYLKAQMYLPADQRDVVTVYLVSEEDRPHFLIYSGDKGWKWVFVNEFVPV